MNDIFTQQAVPPELAARCEIMRDTEPASVLFDNGYMLSSCCRQKPYWDPDAGARSIVEKLEEMGLGDRPVASFIDADGKYSGPPLSGVVCEGVCGSCGRPIRYVVSLVS